MNYVQRKPLESFNKFRASGKMLIFELDELSGRTAKRLRNIKMLFLEQCLLRFIRYQMLVNCV